MDQAKRVGPKLEIVASCSGCAFERSESYAVQGDSGHRVFCDHSDGKGYIGDTTWRTPSWCPLLGAVYRSLGPDPAIGQRIAATHGAAIDDVT